MIRDKYERMLDQFRLYYPGFYDKTVDWWASGRNTVTVKLEDSSMFEFDPMDNSIRRIRIDEYGENETAIRSAFGANLQKMISISGMMKSEIAEKVGITNAMLSRYIRGNSMPSVDRAYMIASVLGCRLEELFDSTYIDED